MRSQPSTPSTFSLRPRGRLTLPSVGAAAMPLLIGLVAAACDGPTAPEGPRPEQGIEADRGLAAVTALADTKAAAAEGGADGETTFMLYVDDSGTGAAFVSTDRDGGQAQAGGWFPLPPELRSLCGTLIECKPCGWAPECQYGVGGNLVAVDPRTDQATIPGPWWNVPKAFVWAICVGLGDIFECKSAERLAVADVRELAARATEPDAHAILVKICGPTVDNGFPGCVLATLR